MKYFFVLGSNPALSLAEITAYFDLNDTNFSNYKLINNQVFVTDLEDFNVIKAIHFLGGTVKIGKVVAETDLKSEILSKIKENLKITTKKFHFGFSSYSERINLKPLAMEFKNHLKSLNVSSRWVTSKEKVLSSVVVEQNKLLTEGTEFVIMESGRKILIGTTLAVQPFKDLSFRDYGRPARDDHSGMLPPKLAQIMLNLSKASIDGKLLDPFCGSGTVLSEAALMGFKNLLGSDLSSKAVEDTKKNLEWTLESYNLKVLEINILKISATELSKNHKPDSIDAIVTEPYLGPQRGAVDTRQIVSELERLYAKSIEEFYKIMKKGGRAVMIWPVFRKGGNIMLNTRILGKFKIIDPLPSNAPLRKLSNRKTIIYGRSDQKVWREILVLEK